MADGEWWMVAGGGGISVFEIWDLRFISGFGFRVSDLFAVRAKPRSVAGGAFCH
jgi:hypothetical protein